MICHYCFISGEIWSRFRTNFLDRTHLNSSSVERYSRRLCDKSFCYFFQLLLQEVLHNLAYCSKTQSQIISSRRRRQGGGWGVKKWASVSSVMSKFFLLCAILQKSVFTYLLGLISPTLLSKMRMHWHTAFGLKCVFQFHWYSYAQVYFYT